MVLARTAKPGTTVPMPRLIELQNWLTDFLIYLLQTFNTCMERIARFDAQF